MHREFPCGLASDVFCVKKFFRSPTLARRAGKHFRTRTGYTEKARINFPDRKRDGYLNYSARVGGVCVLLKSGVDSGTISTPARWGNPMVDRYVKLVALQPTIVEAFAFYNPVSLKHAYSEGVSVERPTKRLKTRD